MQKKIVSLFLCLATVFTMTACSNEEVWTPSSFDTKAVSDKLKDCVVAENDKYILEWNAKYCGVSLIEKETGKRWGTTPFKEGQPEVDEYGLPITAHPQLESAIIVKYLNESTYMEEQVVARTGTVNKGRVCALKQEKGLRVEYYFDEAEIMIPVDYRLREDSVEISIEPNDIQENGNLVTSVAVAPFWCSAENDSEDSYLFFPSGSGALISCDTISQPGISYSASVYGEDPTINIEDMVTVEKAVRLPVYGAKSGNIASCAIIEESAESADIRAIVGSKAIGYSGVYTVFQLRGYSTNNAKFLNGFNQRMQVFAKSMIETPLVVGFYPLTNEDANYSGMAKVYKTYLKGKGELSKKIETETALNLTFVGGSMIHKSFLGIPYQDLLPATTLEDAKEILKDVSNETNTKMSAKLLGYGNTGIDVSKYAGDFKINKNLGSTKKLSILNQYCKENDISLYYDFDLIKLKESSSGYSTLFDSSYSALYKVANGYEYDAVTRSIRSDSKYTFITRELLKDGAEKMMAKIENWNLSGISLSSLSNKAYSDYSDSESTAYYSKGNMSADVSEIMNLVSDKYDIAAEDANAYAATRADVIYNVPVNSSQEFIFKEDVPFYQMVFKGYVSMASESMNTAANPKNHLLRTVESGCGLSYTLIANYENEFIDSKNYLFFGSLYSDVKDAIVATSADLESYYKAINGTEIISHEILANDIRETVFDNGVVVYVNYSDEKLESPLGDIEPLSYVWKGVK